MNRPITLATLFWFEWTFGYALALGFGWRTARPLAIDLADTYGLVTGVVTFLVVLGGILHIVQLPLLAQLSLRPGAGSSSPSVRTGWLSSAGSVALVLAGSIAGLAALMRLGLFYSAFLTWIAVLAVIREVLGTYWLMDPGVPARGSSTWFRPWVSIVALVLLGALAVFGEPWELGDTCRTCGHVPAVVVGVLVGAVTGSVLVRRDPGHGTNPASDQL